MRRWPQWDVRSTGAVLLGGMILVWPALLNSYPILFSDTGGLLEMGFLPSMGWDKPWVYGPLLAALSLHRTLWLPLCVQGIVLSYMLWLTGSSLAGPNASRHLALCLILALATAAPWITATLMPDMLTPVVAIGIAVLSLCRLARAHKIVAGLITTVAIAAHLSHLISAFACIAVAALLRRALPWRAIVSLAAALLFLVASNWIGHGRFGVSPYGSVFALARLIGDGPARDYLARSCPGSGYRLCAWRDQLTPDSDQFLWDPASPFWADPTPLPIFAAEAREIVAATIKTYPRRVAVDALRNAVHQLGRLTLGDTLVADYLDQTVLPRLARFLPGDVPGFEASLQVRGQLLPRAQPLIAIQFAALGLGAIGCAAILWRGIGRPDPLADLTALILIALAANALATGALSTVHDRYQVRIAWLVLIPPFLWLTTRRGDRPVYAARFETSSGDIRTSAS